MEIGLGFIDSPIVTLQCIKRVNGEFLMCIGAIWNADVHARQVNVVTIYIGSTTIILKTKTLSCIFS